MISKRLYTFILRDAYGWSIEKIQKEIEAASARHAEMLGWTNYKLEFSPSKINVEDEPLEYLVRLWNKDIVPKRYLLEWRETVTNNCSVYIEAESEAEALRKWFRPQKVYSVSPVLLKKLLVDRLRTFMRLET